MSIYPNARIEHNDDAVRLTLRPPATPSPEDGWIEIILRRPAEPDTASQPAAIEDDEPTWEDAEFQ